MGSWCDPFLQVWLFSKEWPFLSKCEPFFQVWLTFLCLTHFSKCDSLFQVWLMFSSVTHFSVRQLCYKTVSQKAVYHSMRMWEVFSAVSCLPRKICEIRSVAWNSVFYRLQKLRLSFLKLLEIFRTVVSGKDCCVTTLITAAKETIETLVKVWDRKTWKSCGNTGLRLEFPKHFSFSQTSLVFLQLNRNTVHVFYFVNITA